MIDQKICPVCNKKKSIGFRVCEKCFPRKILKKIPEHILDSQHDKYVIDFVRKFVSENE